MGQTDYNFWKVLIMDNYENNNKLMQALSRRVYFLLNPINSDDFRKEVQSQVMHARDKGMLSTLINTIKEKRNVGNNILLKIEIAKLYFYLLTTKESFDPDMLIHHYARTMYQNYVINKDDITKEFATNGEAFFVEHFKNQFQIFNNLIHESHKKTLLIPIFDYEIPVSMTTKSELIKRVSAVLADDLILDQTIYHHEFEFNIYKRTEYLSFVDYDFRKACGKVYKYFNHVFSNANCD